MMAYGHSGYSRSMSVSSTPIDGVPMVIGSKFRPLAMPTKVNFTHVDEQICSILENDLDVVFGLERHVVDYYNEQRQMQIIAEAEKLQLIGDEIEEFTRPKDSDKSGKSNQNPCKSSDFNEVNGSSQSSSSSTNVFNIGAEILLPTPIQPSKKHVPSKEAFPIDLADFESEEDPFDKLELKTINTMEELKNVLQIAQANSTEQCDKADSETDIRSYENKRVTCENRNGCGIDEHEQNGQGHINSSCLSHYIKTNNNDLSKIVQDSDSIRSDDLPAMSRRTVLPPIGHNVITCSKHKPGIRHSIAGIEHFVECEKNNENNSIPEIESVNHFNPYSRHFKNFPKFDSAHKQENGQLNSEYSANSNQLYLKEDHFSTDLSKPNKLRSAKSTPDITQDRIYRSNSPFKSVSPSPVPRPSSAGSQDWNPHSPLPPLSNSYTATNNSSQKNISATTSPDPFYSLPIGQQEFVLALADMGFQRSLVARAVQKFGPDDKVVIDHLCLLNRIVENGYTTEEAEMSLALFDNDIEKAFHYLEGIKQLKEFGFESTKASEALVLHNNDRDKALDYLTT